MRGKPVLLRNCEEHIDNIITPLMHHRNTANENDGNEGNDIISLFNYRFEQLLLLSKCFQKLSAVEVSESVYMWERVNHFLHVNAF